MADCGTLTSQRELLRDVLLAARENGSWLTLSELSHLSGIPETSVSAQLRHLRKKDFGGHIVEKRVRERIAETLLCCARIVWEYRLCR